MQLRPYQAMALADLQNAYRSGKRAPLLCSPTGSGKSAVTKYMLGRTRKRVLYLCHRDNLLEMIHEDLNSAGVRHGVIAASQHAQPHTFHIHIAMMHTVFRRLDTLPEFDWIISDEAHLVMSPTWLAILKYFSTAWHLGMSATPCRLDGKGLGEVYDQIVYGPSVRELTTRGYLAPCKVLAPKERVQGQWTVSPKLSIDAKARFLNQAPITGSAVEEFRKLGPGHQAVVFCQDRAHAEAVAAQFREAGLRFVNVDGSMPKYEQRSRLRDLVNRGLDGVTNVDLLTTGWDCPQIDVGIDLACTESLALDLQKKGRVLRVSPGKSCAYWLDMVGNVFRHGLPDADREWTLDGRAKRPTAPPVRQCLKCYACFAPAPKCPACGHVFPVQSRGASKTVAREGELVEVTQDDVERRQHYLKTAPLKELLRAAKTRDQIEEIRKARGYHHAWTSRMLAFKSQAKTRAIMMGRSAA